MKVLITADWHLGKRLYQEDLSPDHRHFLNWLIGFIEEEKIDHLVVAGDIFDHANPAHDATRLYYDFLHKLIPTGCKAVFTAGNHDSPSFLEVPRDILSRLNIRVIGAFPGLDRIDDILIELKDRSDELQAVLAAVPFLQDRYLRQVGEGENLTEIKEQLRKGLASIFDALGKRTKEKYPTLPRIATAHLFADKAKKGDAERDIQIGMLDGVPQTDIDHFDYLGLGHIHSGMVIAKDRIKYTGSPISLTFDESKYKHQVTVLDINQGKITPRFIDVPQLRSLHRIKGNKDEVKAAADALKDGPENQPELVEIELLLKTYDPTISDFLGELRKELKDRNLQVVQERVILEKQPGVQSAARLEQAEDLDPVHVFETMLEGETPENRRAMIELFAEIYAAQTQETTETK